MICPFSTLSSLFQTREPWMGSLSPSSSVLIPRDLGNLWLLKPLRQITMFCHEAKPEVVGVSQDLPFTASSSPHESLPLGPTYVSFGPCLSHSLYPFASLPISLCMCLGLFVCFCPSTFLDTHPHPKPCLCFISWFIQTFPVLITHIHSQIFLREAWENPSQGLPPWPRVTSSRWHKDPALPFSSSLYVSTTTTITIPEISIDPPFIAWVNLLCSLPGVIQASRPALTWYVPWHSHSPKVHCGQGQSSTGLGGWTVVETWVGSNRCFFQVI